MRKKCCYGQRRILGQYSSLRPSPTHLSHTTNIPLSRIKCERLYFYKEVCSFIHWSLSLCLIMFRIYLCMYTCSCMYVAIQQPEETGGHIGRNVVEITIKMKTIVRKPLMIKINKIRHRNLDNKHLKKAGGYIGQNDMEITIKMKTIVWKPLMIKINKLHLRNLDNKHLKKASGYISRNIVEITIKMKTIVQKPLMIKILLVTWNSPIWGKITCIRVEYFISYSCKLSESRLITWSLA